MKKVFLIFFLLSLKTQVFSQVVSLGIKGAFISAGISADSAGRLGVNSPAVGVVANVSFSDVFSLQLEGNYYKKGGGFGFRYAGQNYKDIYTFQVVEVPLLAKFTIGKPRVKFIAEVGPYFAYVISAQHKTEDANYKTTENLNNFLAFDANGMKTNRYDAGAQIGTGFSVDIGKGRLFVEGRYAIGFINWFEYNTSQPTPSPNSPFYDVTFKNIRHHVVSVNVGYTIPVWERNKN